MGIALAMAGSTAFAQGTLPDGFIGKFRGTLSDGSGRVDGEFTVVIRRTSSGFEISWPPRTTAQMTSLGQAGMFKASGGSRLLDGDPIYWARLEGANLIVYSAQIGEHGGYRIDSFIYAPSQDGLDLVVRQIAVGAEPRILNGKLTRYGG